MTSEMSDKQALRVLQYQATMPALEMAIAKNNGADISHFSLSIVCLKMSFNALWPVQQTVDFRTSLEITFIRNFDRV